MIFCLIICPTRDNLSLLKHTSSLCIQKLLIPIEMIYSGIKLMVLCAAYHLTMVMNLENAETTRNPTTCAGSLCCSLGRPY